MNLFVFVLFLFLIKVFFKGMIFIGIVVSICNMIISNCYLLLILLLIVMEDGEIERVFYFKVIFFINL